MKSEYHGPPKTYIFRGVLFMVNNLVFEAAGMTSGLWVKVIQDVRDVRDTSPRCAIFNGETFDVFFGSEEP